MIQVLGEGESALGATLAWTAAREDAPRARWAPSPAHWLAAPLADSARSRLTGAGNDADLPRGLGRHFLRVGDLAIVLRGPPSRDVGRDRAAASGRSREEAEKAARPRHGLAVCARGGSRPGRSSRRGARGESKAPRTGTTGFLPSVFPLPDRDSGLQNRHERV